MNTFGDILLTAVAGVTLLAAPASAAGASGGAQPGGQPAGLAAAGLPHQYAALVVRNGSTANSFRDRLVIRDTATGRNIAARLAPRPANSFCDLTGTPDGRTFVAEACKVTVVPLDGGVEVARPVRYYRLTVDGQGHVGRLRPLRIPVPSISSMDGATVSPGGRKLAVASADHRGFLAHNPAIRLYNLGTGRLLRTWRWAGRADIIGRNGIDDGSIDPLSWTADGRTIAFPLMTGPEQEKTQVRLLEVAAPGSNLRRSRPVVNLGTGPGFFEEGFSGELDGQDSMITPDGSRVVASTATEAGTGPNSTTRLTVSEFSVRTGARVAVLHSVTSADSPFFYLQVLWSSPDGRAVIAVGGKGYGLAKPIDIMTGGGFTPLPGETDRIDQLAF